MPELPDSGSSLRETEKSVGGGVSELRVDYGPGYRLYIGEAGASLILMLCGGDKRTQDADIKQAKAYWAGYKARKKEPNANAKKKAK